MFKTFLRHPSIFFLPVFTPFTFTSSKKTCCAKGNEEEGHIRFSVKASLCNLFASLSTSVIYALYVLHHANIDEHTKIRVGDAALTLQFTGTLLNLLFLCNARPTTNRFNCCCCSCCSCCSCEAAIEYGVYKSDSPAQHFILRINAD